MDYRVDEISLEDVRVEGEVEQLIGQAFGIPMPSGRVRRNTAAPGRPPPLYVAAVQDSTIIGFNSFTAHLLTINGEEVLAYQSGWTATSAAHRGKKIFQNLILAAQEILAARGAGFIFGFPNAASHPIFVGKLGYRQISAVKWQVPNLPYAARLFARSAAADLSELTRDAALQDDRALIALKRNESDLQIKEFLHEGSFCWAVRRSRSIAGFNLSYVDVGGLQLVGARHLPVLIEGLLKHFPGAVYAQLVSTEGAPYNQLMKRVRPSTSNVLIVRDLNCDTQGLRFNFFGGVRDVY
jgi:predicted N-acetyltransferase YhbS